MKRKIEIDLPWSEMEHLIDEWIWSEQARRMLKDKLYYEEMTFDQLSEKYHLSLQHTKKIIYRAEEKVFSKIPPEYIK